MRVILSQLVRIVQQIVFSLANIGLFCQAEDGIRDLVRSRGLGDVYKRQDLWWSGSSYREHYCQAERF